MNDEELYREALALLKRHGIVTANLLQREGMRKVVMRPLTAREKGDRG